MGQLSGLGWMLVTLGVIIVVVGLAFVFLPSISWFGRLPGDIRVERPRFQFYFPLVSCLLLSVVLSLVFWIIRLFSGRP